MHGGAIDSRCDGSRPNTSGDWHDGLGAGMCQLLHGVRDQDGRGEDGVWDSLWPFCNVGCFASGPSSN